MSKSGDKPFIAATDTRGLLYTWGPNDVGQLGHGDFESRALPSLVLQLRRKSIKQIKLGHDFLLALGSNVSESTKEMKR